MAKSIDDLSLNDQLPESIKPDSQVQSAVVAIDPWLKLAAQVRHYPSVLYNLDILSSLVLDHLATQFNMTAWDSTWDVERKRSVLRAFLIAYKTRVGTVFAVKQAIESFGSGVILTEWWQKEPKGQPHTFEVKSIVPDGLTIDEQVNLRQLIDAAKPVRSHYTLTVQCQPGGNFYVWTGSRNLSMFQFESKQTRELPIDIEGSCTVDTHSCDLNIDQFSS